jgi:hypothetical protein
MSRWPMSGWSSLALIFALTLSPGSALAQMSRISLDDAIRGYESATHATFRGVPEDWSTHHVSFAHPTPGSRAATAAEADPRYWLQQLRQAMSPGPVVSTAFATTSAAATKIPVQRDWSMDLGANAKVGSGQYPAKFAFTDSGPPSCLTDFVVFNTGLAGSTTQASILAYNQIYKTLCTPTVPVTYWAYNTGGTIALSPVLSLDGSQIAFVQTAGNVASLVVMKWPADEWPAGGTASSPVTLSVSGGYPNCTAPCMISLTFDGSPNDKSSAPFYDYSGSDTLFVGDATGKLHQFHPVFDGPPAEVTTGGFPLKVSQDHQPLADPVYDSGLGMVFVGDGHASKGSDDGEVHAITVSSAAVVNSAPVCQGPGFLDGPILDPVAGELYFTCGHDVGGGACTSANACLRQFGELTISGSSGVPEPLGLDFDCTVAPGAFDNIYLNSSDSSPTGNYYVCGNPGGAPTLYLVPVTNNVVGTPVAVATLANQDAWYNACSPVTEFYNSAMATDWMFVSVAANGAQNACTSATGCVYSFDATSPLAAGATATAGLPSSGGSSGIIVDNVGAATSTVANVYYSTLGNQACTTSGGTGGCAVQASQNQLQ